MTDRSNTGFIGSLDKVHITLGNITAHLNFLAVRNTPLDLIIGLSFLDQMRAVIDFVGQFVDLKNGDEIDRIGLETNSGKPFGSVEEFGEDELFIFTSSGG